MADDANDVAVETEASEAVEERIDQAVDVADSGPCKKHLKITVPRHEIEKFFDKEFSTLVESASVPGFRKGKTPRRLIEKKFRKDVADQVKVTLLMQSLEQIGTEQKIEPLSEPEIDIHAIDLPEDGDFVYEFDVEVRPEFDLPSYKGLELTRPTKEFTDADIDEGLKELLSRNATMVVKEGAVEVGDYVEVDVRFLDGDEVINEANGLSLRVDKELVFRDGKIDNFAESMVGAKAGDAREIKAVLSNSIVDESRRGKEITAVFVISEVRSQILPELNDEFFRSVGVSNEGELRDIVRDGLERRLEYAQRQSTREQVMEKLVESADLDLPQDLLRRQTDRALQRTIMELQSAGYGDEEIRSRINMLRQDSLASTAKLLKQQFVLQRIAEEEEIKVEDDDLNAEVQAIAERSNESVRRVRARIEKENLWDSVALHVLESKTIQKIVSAALQVDVPWEEDKQQRSAMDESAVPEQQATEEVDETVDHPPSE